MADDETRSTVEPTDAGVAAEDMELSDRDLARVSGGLGGVAKMEVEPVDFKPKGSLLGMEVEPVDFKPRPSF